MERKRNGSTGGSGDRPFQRRIRRYAHAPVHRFIAVAPPELRSLCEGELRNLGFLETRITEAGVEFTGKLSACYLANLWLRTASRVLIRLPEFRAGAPEELFGKTAAFSWELWLDPIVPLQIEAHVRYSRISHEGVVADTILGAIKRRLADQGIGLSSSPGEHIRGVEDVDQGFADRQRVIVHLRKNHCEISLDTTGAHLHQRGYRLAHAGAPLRETLAAAILMRAGWRWDLPLVDGMCGAGTVPIEASLLARRIPPGLRRTFLFQRWPAFQEKTWGHLLKVASTGIIAHQPAPLIAVDRDPEALSLAFRNAERAGVSLDIHWKEMDFFSFKPQDHGIGPGMLFLNPPYGRRLPGGGADFFDRLGSHMRQFFEGWQAAVLVPERATAGRLKLRSMRYWHIVHGGVPIVVVMARL